MALSFTMAANVRNVGAPGRRAGGVVRLSGGPPGGLSPADVAREVPRQNNVIVGSVNADRRHVERTVETLAAADHDWLVQPISRGVPPDHITDAPTRGPDRIEVVVDLRG